MNANNADCIIYSNVGTETRIPIILLALSMGTGAAAVVLIIKRCCFGASVVILFAVLVPILAESKSRS